MSDGQRTIWYGPVGPPDGLRLLCLPGTMCAPSVFAPFGQALGRRVEVAPWLEWDGPHRMDALADAVLRWCPATAPVVLIGHSTGGVIALLAAIRGRRGGASTGGLVGVVVCDTGANMHGHGDVDAIIEKVCQEWGRELWRAFVRRSVFRALPPNQLDELVDYPHRLDPARVVQALRSQRATDLLPDLPTLDVPVLVVHGEHDEARSLHHARELATEIPDAELVRLDCGHTPPVELPHETAEAVRDWLARRIMREPPPSAAPARQAPR